MPMTQGLTDLPAGTKSSPASQTGLDTGWVQRLYPKLSPSVLLGPLSTLSAWAHGLVILALCSPLGWVRAASAGA